MGPLIVYIHMYVHVPAKIHWYSEQTQGEYSARAPYDLLFTSPNVIQQPDSEIGKCTADSAYQS